MNHNVRWLTGLLFVSYFGLLWLTSSEHRASNRVNAGEANHTVAQFTRSAPENQSLASSSQESVARESPAAEDESLSDPDPQTTEAEVQAAYTSEATSQPPQSIEAATYALRSEGDRGIRLAAVNALLLRGRQSKVDPAILQALKDASVDTDQVVAALANSALTEVERATH